MPHKYKNRTINTGTVIKILAPNENGKVVNKYITFDRLCHDVLYSHYLGLQKLRKHVNSLNTSECIESGEARDINKILVKINNMLLNLNINIVVAVD